MKHYLSQKTFLLISLFCFMSGCHYSKTIQHSKPLNIDNTQQQNTDQFLNAEYIQNKVLSTCIDCHSAGKKQPELTSVSQVVNNFKSILDEVMLNSMPPQKKGYKPLSDCDKAALLVWEKLNFPETSDFKLKEIPECLLEVPITQQPPVTPEPQKPVIDVNTLLSYDVLTKTSLSTCLDCHTAGKKEPTLETYEDVKNAIYEIRYAVREVESMPPQRKGYHPLSDCEKQMVHEWVEISTPLVSDKRIGDIPGCENFTPLR